jgi:glyoxylase-like metal-dependent hydrolase (beta-lactamase superfamily II)
MGETERFVCIQCGTQHADSAGPPARCAICDEERQFVRPGGQAWTTLGELRRVHRQVFAEEGEGLTGIAVAPAFAINQRPLLIAAKGGNVLWDCNTVLTKEGIAEIERRGGLKAIAISHPHYYSTMLEWSAAFGDVPVYLHADDREWVQRSGPALAFWPGETLALDGEITLIRCGGHFAGACVLHWSAGEGGRGALLTGDTAMVARDRRHVSFMYSYPNYLPLGAAAVRRIAAAVEPFAFDSIYGPMVDLNVKGGGKAAFTASVARYLRAIGG